MAKLSFDMAGDVEPRILRISRMREENMLFAFVPTFSSISISS